LADPEIAAEAKSVLRSMIKTIKIAPGAKRGEVLLELHGELAAVLAAGQAKRNKDGAAGGANSSLGGCGGSNPPIPNCASLEVHWV
jgi:hypothetical protein